MALRELVDRTDGRLDYSAQVDDLERYEVIEGIVVPAPARHPRHQWLSARLSAALLPVVGEQDLVVKARANAAAGLKHYWVVRIGNDAPASSTRTSASAPRWSAGRRWSATASTATSRSR